MNSKIHTINRKITKAFILILVQACSYTIAYSTQLPQRETLNNDRMCGQFPGSSVAASLAQCLKDIPTTGGTADAGTLAGVINEDPFIGITKPLTLKLGA